MKLTEAYRFFCKTVKTVRIFDFWVFSPRLKSCLHAIVRYGTQAWASKKKPVFTVVLTTFNNVQCKNLIWKNIKNEKGFTLVESVVAMSLFVIIVLGLLSSASSLMFSPKNEQLQEALLLAQNELQTLGEKGSIYTEKKVTEKFIVDREVFKKSGRIEVVISISSEKQPEKNLVSLSKVILASNEK